MLEHLTTLTPEQIDEAQGQLSEAGRVRLKQIVANMCDCIRQYIDLVVSEGPQVIQEDWTPEQRESWDNMQLAKKLFDDGMSYAEVNAILLSENRTAQ